MTNKNKTIFALIKEKELSNHPILNDKQLDESNYEVSNVSIPVKENNSSVWPVDNNILIESVSLNNNLLNITLTNLSVDSINIIEMGVKYGPDMNENIEFQPTNITIPPGESTVQIPCPRGKPFKFVIRTANRTGAGSDLNSMNW